MLVATPEEGTVYASLLRAAAGHRALGDEAPIELEQEEPPAGDPSHPPADELEPQPPPKRRKRAST